MVAPFAHHPLAAARALDTRALLRVGYLVVAGSCIAPFLQVLAQRVLPAGRVGLLFALEPVFALAFALGVGGERFELRWWIGAAMILAGVVGVEGLALEEARRSSRRD